MSSPHTSTLTPINNDELAELDEFLLADEERLPIDEAHGFITAMLVAAQPLSDEEWLFAVWDGTQFADDKEKQRMTTLMLRLRDDVASMLQSGKPFEPMVIEEEEDGEIIEDYVGWCFGFMLGIANNQDQWDRLPEKEQDLLRPIASLALLHNEEEALDDEEYVMCVELLPGSVTGLYAYWQVHQ